MNIFFGAYLMFRIEVDLLVPYNFMYANEKSHFQIISQSS